MNRLETKRKLTSLDEMFGMPSPAEETFIQDQDKVPGESSKTGSSRQEVQKLPIQSLYPRHNHKFQVNLGKKNDDLLKSIQEFGVLEPIIVRPIHSISKQDENQSYEILAGHRRTSMAKEAGLTEIPVRIMTGLTEAEADLIETETNLLQRSWNDMSHSERAAVLYAHYHAVSDKGIRKGFLEEINAEIKTLANPVESRAEGSLSLLGTKGNIRSSGEAYELSKNTVARYLRIYTLSNQLKDRMDLDEIPLYAGVELSYLTSEHQKELDTLLDNYKLDIKKAEELRRLEAKGVLNSESMRKVLTGAYKEKKPGRPKTFKLQDSIIRKYFTEGTKAKEIEATIEAALEAYFQNISG